MLTLLSRIVSATIKSVVIDDFQEPNSAICVMVRMNIYYSIYFNFVIVNCQVLNIPFHFHLILIKLNELL